MRTPLLIAGSSKHASVILDALMFQSQYTVVGLLDSFKPKGTRSHSYPVVGPVEEVGQIAASLSCTSFFVAVGHNSRRSEVSSRIAAEVKGACFVTIIHPHTSIAKSSQIGPGTAVLAGVVVGVNCRIGSGCILNTSCSIDHDCELGDFASIGPGAHVGGSVSIGSRSAICIGATLSHELTVGADAVVGAGAVVVSSVQDGVVTYGVPARVVRNRAATDEYL